MATAALPARAFSFYPLCLIPRTCKNTDCNGVYGEADVAFEISPSVCFDSSKFEVPATAMEPPALQAICPHSPRSFHNLNEAAKERLNLDAVGPVTMSGYFFHKTHGQVTV